MSVFEEEKKAKFQSLKEAFDTEDNQASIYQTMDPSNCTTYQYQSCQLYYEDYKQKCTLLKYILALLYKGHQRMWPYDKKIS